MFGGVRGRPYSCQLLRAWILFHLLQLKCVCWASKLHQDVVSHCCEVVATSVTVSLAPTRASVICDFPLPVVHPPHLLLKGLFYFFEPEYLLMPTISFSYLLCVSQRAFLLT